MPTRCSRCGIESRLRSAFRSAGGLLLRQRLLCPRCWTRRQISSQRRDLVTLIRLAVLGLLFGFAAPFFDFGPDALVFQVGASLLAVICLILPLQIVLIVPHELGHAVTARLLGLRVFRISVGVLGKTLWERGVFGCTLELKSLPVIGMTRAAHKTRRWVRLKLFLMILAGPLVNIALLSTLVYLLHVSSDSVGIINVMLLALFGSNLLMLAINLLPWRIAGSIASDGLQLLSIPFLSGAKVRALHTAYFLLEGTICLERKEWTSARAWFERGLQASSEDALLWNCLGITEIHQRKYVEARNRFEKLLEHPDLDPATRAMVLNNLAWADLCIGKPDLLGEADRHSRESMEWLPWLPAVKGTRGSVLVELGQTEEGIVLLREAVEEHTKAESKALNACYLAIGLAKRGDLLAAEARLEEARKLDPQCFLLEKAVRVAGARIGT